MWLLKGLHQGLVALHTLFKNLFVLVVDVCMAYHSCSTLIRLLSVGNGLKTCITSVDIGKALVTIFPVQQIHSSVKTSWQIDRGHIKVPQNKCRYTKYVDDKK